VLNIDPRAPYSNSYIKISGAWDLLGQLLRHAWNDWMFQVHTNGHNPKSWIIALVCGLAAQLGPGATLTLHSGIAPAYIRGASSWMRKLIRIACALYGRVICVNEEIASAVSHLGIAKKRIDIIPAFLPMDAPNVVIPAEIESWRERHSPVVTSTMWFRPEYGFEVLAQAIGHLREQHPRIGCLVMGTGEDREQAAALVAQHDLKDAIYLAGDLDHELCLALMARSEVFIRPTFIDGDSISVREAVMLGVPAVASNVGTRPDGVLLFEAGDVDGLVKRVDQAIARAKHD